MSRHNLPYHCGKSRKCWEREWAGISPTGLSVFTADIGDGYMLHTDRGFSYHSHRGRKNEIGTAEYGTRQAICRACQDYAQESDKCRLISCSCSISDYAHRPWSACPAGKWSVALVNNKPILSETGV